MRLCKLECKVKIYFSAYDKNGKTRKYLKPSIGRIHALLRHDKYQKYMLKVEYGMQKCAQGCVCMFDNEIKGTKEDIKWALSAFTTEYETN